MPGLCSFLWDAFLSAGDLTVKAAQKVYREKAVLLCAGLVFAATAFTSSGFGGGGKTALTVFAETSSREVDDGDEETEILTKDDARMQKGQQLVGNLLVKELTEEKEERIRTREKLSGVRAEIWQEELQKQHEMKKEELKRAEEARQRAVSAPASAAAVVSMTQDDYRVLLRIVQAEAGICDRKGRILVANVILNRVRSDEFPDTVTEVVYQRAQFSPVSDGSIDTCEVTQETIDCVRRAINGEDYSQGALYFMNRSGASFKNRTWFDSHLTYLFSHDRHEFFK